jgi:hypothetical protein
MSETKNVSAADAEIYDFLAHEYGYSIEYIKELDILTVLNLVRTAVKRKKRDLVQLCNLIRTAVYGDREVKESDVPEENSEAALRTLIKGMTHATDAQIDEMKEHGIEIPI